MHNGTKIFAKASSICRSTWLAGFHLFDGFRVLYLSIFPKSPPIRSLQKVKNKKKEGERKENRKVGLEVMGSLHI